VFIKPFLRSRNALTDIFGNRVITSQAAQSHLAGRKLWIAFTAVLWKKHDDKTAEREETNGKMT
jgi:hypothetical protein